jgi:uncharacterized membrane protein YdcZ (DUF606 family)
MIIGITLAFISGCVSVISKMINFKLTEKIGLLNGTLVNYIVASFISIIVIFLIKSNNIFNFKVLSTVPYWIYLGGVLGLASLLLTIISLPKIPVTYSTILILIGQLTAGFIIDIWISGKFSYIKLLGVLLVTLGICLDKLWANYLSAESS